MCIRLHPMMAGSRERLRFDSTSLIGLAPKGKPTQKAWRLSRLLNNSQRRPRHGSWGGSWGLGLDLRGVHEKRVIARTGDLPWACTWAVGTLLEPREMFRLHCPGSRLDRRPGPAATHFGNRRFEDSGRWARQTAYQWACLVKAELA